MAILKAGFAPANAALTDSDLVAVTNAPITVHLISLLGPIMCLALLLGSLIQLMNHQLRSNSQDGGIQNNSYTKSLSVKHELS